MKKIILLLILISGLAFGQSKITIEKEGLINTSQVFAIPKKTQKQIYDNILLYLNKLYKKPEEAIISKITDQYIKFNGVSEKKIYYNFHKDYKDEMPNYDYSELNYSFEINIKPGKVQINLLDTSREYILYKTKSIMSKNPETKYDEENYIKDGLGKYFNKDGSIKDENKKTKEDFESIINTIVNDVIEAAKGVKNNW